MTDAEKREAAHQFINRWMGRGNEDEDGRSYDDSGCHRMKFIKYI